MERLEEVKQIDINTENPNVWELVKHWNWLVEQAEKVGQLQEDMQEISEVVESFYTESNGMRVPKDLEPIASRLGLIHRVALGKTRKI